MYTITGFFNEIGRAERAIQALYDTGFVLAHGPASDGTSAGNDDSDALSSIDQSFDVSLMPATSSGAVESPKSAIAGVAVGGAIGLIIGVSALPIVGIAAPLAGVGVGAYGGSLLGALKGMKPAEKPDSQHADTNDMQPETQADEEEPDHAHIERGEGSVITVVAHDAAARAKAVNVLWTNGAATVIEGE